MYLTASPRKRSPPATPYTSHGHSGSPSCSKEADGNRRTCCGKDRESERG